MPWYLVIDGKKQEKDEDIFDQMVQALNPETVQEPPIQTSTRWKPDGTFDSKPLDPNCGHTIFIQIHFIKTSSNQHLYEKQMPMLKSIFSQ